MHRKFDVGPFRPNRTQQNVMVTLGFRSVVAFLEVVQLRRFYPGWLFSHYLDSRLKKFRCHKVVSLPRFFIAYRFGNPAQVQSTQGRRAINLTPISVIAKQDIGRQLPEWAYLSLGAQYPNPSQRGAHNGSPL